jgi:hypothetical protein
VAQSQAEVEALQKDLDNICDWTSSVEALSCSYVVIRAPLVAKILIGKLGKFKNPPAEIQPLIQRTVESAKVIAKTNVSDCARDSEGAGCEGTMVAIKSDTQNLLETLAGWKPYT